MTRHLQVKQPQFQVVNPNDEKIIELISDWYLSEWNIPKGKTIKRLKSFSKDSSQFQVLMTLHNVPIAAGGLYNHVALLDKEPRFRIYKNWLGLVYTIPDKRHQGFDDRGGRRSRLPERSRLGHKMGIGLFVQTDSALRLLPAGAR